MRKLDPITSSIIFITIVVFGGIILAAIKSQGIPITQYKITDAERPQLEILETNFDFGQMKLSEIKTKEIVIKNRGRKPLVISDLITSCDCTFAQLLVDGRESPRFSMRRDSKWRDEISPAGEAKLRIIYEPRIMPVQGRVRREIVFKTNDPSSPLVNLRFDAVIK